MCRIDVQLSAIQSSSRGPNTLALFDYDGTLIAGLSALYILVEQYRRGDINRKDLLTVGLGMLNHKLGLSDDQALMELGASFITGDTKQAFSELCETVFQRHLYKRIYPEASSLVRAHQQQGHTVVIASSAPAEAVAPVARELGIDRIVSSRYLTRDNRYSGDVAMPVCWGFGKRLAAEQLADDLGACLEQAFFYSDSAEDLPLMEKAGHPVAVNPDDVLRQQATVNKWPCIVFAPRNTSLRAVGSAAGVYLSLVGSYIGGLGVARLKGDREQGRSFMLDHFTSSVSAMIGMKLDIINEHHLRDSPPCVVIFNHQSVADGFIILQLLREKYTGIGKRAFRRIPLLSEAYEFAGVIPVDRDDSQSAIASMAPLVDAIQTEGRSVAIAPEGTRSLSRKPGPFKKGAFHLALDAKVNLLPIVIHNSMDIQPKGDPFFHPATVKVEILPTVDTSRWHRKNIDKHIADVRNLYLKSMGYPKEIISRKQKQNTKKKAENKRMTESRS